MAGKKEVPVPQKDAKPVDSGSRVSGSSGVRTKYIFIVFVAVAVLAFIALDIATDSSGDDAAPACGDGTLHDTCSSDKPYFCESETGKLVERASVCGCSETGNLTRSGDSCVSGFATGENTVNLKYVLRGEEGSISFPVYDGMANYLSGVSRIITHDIGEEPSRADFKLRSMDDVNQRELLIPLVKEIQEITGDKQDQIRIAVSIVQSIPYGFSDRTISLRGTPVNYSRYPYEVLYENEGICGEKSALLAFILREMGYETVFFFHAPENHESIGIRCPVEESLDETGYCFIETTAPSIITDNTIEYVGGITLDSQPEVIRVSEGDAIGKNGWYEFEDADDLASVKKRKLPILGDRKINSLTEKYGLVTEYHPA